MLTLEEGRQCKFLNVLETLVQEEKMALAPIVSHLVQSPLRLTEYNRVVASSQFVFNRLCSDNYIFF